MADSSTSGGGDDIVYCVVLEMHGGVDEGVSDTLSSCRH